jgi:hypothetical protein
MADDLAATCCPTRSRHPHRHDPGDLARDRGDSAAGGGRGSTFITVDPNGPFSKFTALPIQIYQWTARPQSEFRNLAAAAIIVLLVLLLSLNFSAILLRNRFSRRLM